MSEVLTAADEAALQRRRFLRGGALLAAAAGGAVAATATSALPAAAATGGNVVLGAANEAGRTTEVASTARTEVALRLANPSGAALELAAATEVVDLSLNQLAGSTDGPRVSTLDADSGQPYTDFVATLSDVAQVPVVDYYFPSRILDTTSTKGRGAIVGKSSGALDTKGRLKKGAYIDVAVEATNLDYTPDAAFVTLTSSGSTKDGSLSAYVTGYSRGGTVTVSFIKKKTLSGAAFVGLQKLGGDFVFRIYATQTTHVAVDLTGVSYYPVPGPDAQANARSVARTARRTARAARRTTG